MTNTPKLDELLGNSSLPYTNKEYDDLVEGELGFYSTMMKKGELYGNGYQAAMLFRDDNNGKGKVIMFPYQEYVYRM